MKLIFSIRCVDVYFVLCELLARVIMLRWLDWLSRKMLPAWLRWEPQEKLPHQLLILPPSRCLISPQCFPPKQVDFESKHPIVTCDDLYLCQINLY